MRVIDTIFRLYLRSTELTPCVDSASSDEKIIKKRFKAGDILMCGKNLFFMVLYEYNILIATTFFELCDSSCMIVGSETPLTEAWGILPIKRSIDESIISSCDKVDEIPLEKVRIMADFIDGKIEDLPDAVRGFSVPESPDTLYSMFLQREDIRTGFLEGRADFIDFESILGNMVEDSMRNFDDFDIPIPMTISLSAMPILSKKLPLDIFKKKGIIKRFMERLFSDGNKEKRLPDNIKIFVEDEYMMLLIKIDKKMIGKAGEIFIADDVIISEIFKEEYRINLGRTNFLIEEAVSRFIAENIIIKLA